MASIEHAQRSVLPTPCHRRNMAKPLPSYEKIDALESNLAKCLALSAMLRSQEILDEIEVAKVKTFLMSIQDAAKLCHIVRNFETFRSLSKFCRSVGGFMGDPWLGQRKRRQSKPVKGGSCLKCFAESLDSSRLFLEVWEI